MAVQAAGPRIRVYVFGAAGGTAHPMWGILAGQHKALRTAMAEQVRFVAMVKNPERDWERLVRSDVYSQQFTHLDAVQWDSASGLLTLNDVPVEVRTDKVLRDKPTRSDEFGIFVNYGNDDTAAGTGSVLVDPGCHGKIKVAIKPQAFKSKSEGTKFRGRADEDWPHVIPNINDDSLKADAELVSQASCTTGGAASVIKPLLQIPGFEILPGSTLLTIHGTTASDQGPEIAGDMRFGETGANKALRVVFGDRLPGIMNLAGRAVRGPWVVPSSNKINLTVAVAADEELNYAKVLKLYLDAANSPAFRMMLGLYFVPEGEKNLKFSLFKGEGRTAVLVASPDYLKVSGPLGITTDNRRIYNLVIDAGFYDNVFGYVGNTLDLINLVINRKGVLPDQLPPIDKVRLPWVLPQFSLA